MIEIQEIIKTLSAIYIYLTAHPLPAVIDQRITYALHDLLRTEPGAVGRSVINVKTESKRAADKLN